MERFQRLKKKKINRKVTISRIQIGMRYMFQNLGFVKTEERLKEKEVTFSSSSKISSFHQWPASCASNLERYLQIRGREEEESMRKKVELSEEMENRLGFIYPCSLSGRTKKRSSSSRSGTLALLKCEKLVCTPLIFSVTTKNSLDQQFTNIPLSLQELQNTPL